MLPARSETRQSGLKLTRFSGAVMVGRSGRKGRQGVVPFEGEG